MSQQPTPQQALSATLQKCTQLQQLLQHLSPTTADQLEQVTNPAQYLQLLGNLLYTLNCVTHSYAHLRSLPVPEEFGAVKEYYNRIRGVLAEMEGKGGLKQEGKDGAPRINKEVVSRIIKRNT